MEKTRAERRREEREIKKGGKRSYLWDIFIAGFVILAGVAFIYLYNTWWTDKTTYGPGEENSYDQYAPDDGTDKGLIIQTVPIPTPQK